MTEAMTEPPAQAFTGGCQCGAVRYAGHAPLEKIHLCHCRMCQRAVGNVFAALAGVPKERFEWTRGTPGQFASSSLATRGFCPACGTPLFFSYNDSPRIYVTIGSLDNPTVAVPEKQYGIEKPVALAARQHRSVARGDAEKRKAGGDDGSPVRREHDAWLKKRNAPSATRR